MFHRRGWHYLLLTLLGFTLFFWNLGGATLWDLDEGRNAMCAYEMLRSGDWIVPTFNGELRDHKPVLLYWLHAICYFCFGVNEFAARVPSAVAALATVLLCYELARSMFGRMSGLLAGIVVASSPMLCGAGRFANPDALLNCFTVLTMTIFWLGVRTRRKRWFLGLGAAAGLAMLAKGPVGFVLPAAVATLFTLWERRWHVWLTWRWTLTILSFTLIGVPWFVLVGLETHGKFLTGFFLTHNYERAASTMENHRGFPGYYIVVLLVGMAPWSIFLLLAWWTGFRSAFRGFGLNFDTPDAPARDSASDRAGASGSLRGHVEANRLLICWIAVYLLAFSIAATKLPNYVLPTVVPCAILLGRWLDRLRFEAMRPWITNSAAAALILIGVGTGVGLAIAGGAWELMRGRTIDGLASWAPIGLVPIAGGLVGWYFAQRQQRGRFIAVFAVTAALLWGPLAAYASAILNKVKAPQPLVEQIQTWSDADDIRIGCWNLAHLPSVNFYVQRNVEDLNASKDSHERDIAGFLAYRLPVYLFIPLEDWRRMESRYGRGGRVVGQHYDMYHHCEVVVVTNR